MAHREAKIVAKQVLPRGYSEVYEKEYRHKEEPLSVDLRTYPLFVMMPAARKMWAIVRDITERKRRRTHCGKRSSSFILLWMRCGLTSRSWTRTAALSQ